MKTKRQKEVAWRSVRYGLMVTVIISMTAVLFFIMLGYRFNQSSGKFQQGGLVQFISKPEGARVTAGSVQLANKTRSKITLIPGDYLVKMELDNYELWQKNISVTAGSVLWLNSARLVPRDLQTSSVLAMKTVTSTAVRAEGRYMAILENARELRITKVTLADGDVLPVQISVDEDRYAAGKKHRFTLGEWSANDRHVLVRHDYDKLSEWLLVDTEVPSETIRVPVIGKVQPSRVLYDPRSQTNLVAQYSDGSVRLVNGTTGLVSDPILRDIKQLTTVGASLVYVTNLKDGKTEVGYLTLDSPKPYTLGAYATKEPVLAAISHYFKDYYLATTIGKKTTIELLPNLPPSDSTLPFTRTVAEVFSSTTAPLSVDVKNDGRFIVVSQPKFVGVYDVELGKFSETPIVGQKNPLTRPPAWLDDQHFWSDAGGVLRQYEFDGSNQAVIAPTASGFSAGYSPNGTYLYNIVKQKNGYELQRTRMIIQ